MAACLAGSASQRGRRRGLESACFGLNAMVALIAPPDQAAQRLGEAGIPLQRPSISRRRCWSWSRKFHLHIRTLRRGIMVELDRAQTDSLAFVWGPLQSSSFFIFILTS
jgi:hypothetical protein